MRSIQNVTIYEFRRSPNQYRGTHKLRILNRNVTITSARKLPSNNESLIRYNHCTLVRSICGIIDERTVILTEAKFVVCHQRATLTYHPDEDQIQYNTIQYNTIQSNTIKYNQIQYNTNTNTLKCADLANQHKTDNCSIKDLDIDL